MQRVKKIEVYIIITLIIISILQAVWLFKGQVFDNVDSGLQGYINFSQFFSNNFFIWNSFDYTGLIGTFNSSIMFLLSIFNILFNSILGLIVSAEVFFGLLIAIGNLSIFFLLYKFLDNKSLTTKVLAGSFAVVLFGIFSAAANGPDYTIIGWLPASLFFAYVFAEKINLKENDAAKYIYLSIFILFLAILFSGGGAWIIQDVIAIIFPLLFLSLFNKNHKKKLFGYYALAIILALIIAFPVFGSTEMFTKVVGNDFFNSGSLWILKNLNVQNIFTSLQLSDFNNAYLTIYWVAVVIFSLISLLYLKELKGEKRAFIIGSFISFFVIVFIWDNFGLPFGAIFNILLNHFNELLVFRYSGSSLYYVVDFFYAIFGGLGIAFSYEKIKNYKIDIAKKNLAIALFIIFIIFLIGIKVYYYDYSNYTSYSGIIIPQHVYSIANYINSQSGNFNVGLLPVAAPFMQFDSWYSGTNLYTYFINNPSFTGAYVAASQLFFPPSQYEYYNFASQVDSGSLSGNSISNAFGALGIKYMVVQGDTLHAGDENYFNFNSIYSNLNNSNNIFFVKRYSNSSIYENKNYDPLVYASNAENLGNATTTEIFDRISNDTFNIQNTSVFVTNITGLYNDSITINATPIPHFSKPGIGFVVDNPTQATVHITNATTPFYLVYRETYDKHWAAYYSNGSEVNPYNHIVVNGFANAWYMNKTGNYTITLYYTLQTDADVMWVVSFAGLFAAIGIGVWRWRKR